MLLTNACLSLLLPSLTLAQEQKPLMDQAQEYFEIAKTYLPAGIQNAINPVVSSGAARIAGKNVVELNRTNWDTILTPSSSLGASAGPENWMVLISGGNKTCFGLCDGIEAAWNKSAAILSATPGAPKLGYLNCDEQAILCSIWFAGPPSLWYIERAVVPGNPNPIHIMTLNTTTTTAADIVAIHAQKKYLDRPLYEGAFHPWDGYLVKACLNVPIGYILFGFALIPSWAFMLLISLASRTIMSRRTGNPNVAAQQAQAAAVPQGGAPAANQ